MDRLPDVSSLSHNEKDALIRALWAQVQALTAQVGSLTTQVAELEAKLLKRDCRRFGVRTTLPFAFGVSGSSGVSSNTVHFMR